MKYCIEIRKLIPVLIIFLQLLTFSAKAQGQFIQHNIDLNFRGACSVGAYDLDGDGDLDILGAGNTGKHISWWRSEGGYPIGFTEFEIDTDIYGIIYAAASDIDNDNDLDVMGASWNRDWIIVWQNKGGNPITWEKDTLDSNIAGAHEVHAVDINKDGLLDIIAAGGEDNTIVWYQNNGNSVNTWNKHTVDAQFTGSRAVVSADINNDSFPDLIGAALTANQVCVWFNDGNSPINWSKQIVDDAFRGAHWVHTCDLDQDGDIDILGAAAIGNQIGWWRNDGGNPIQWSKQVLSFSFGGALSVAAGDLDGDNDLDIFGAAINHNKVTWWRNNGGTPISWQANIISTNYNGAWPVYGADLDEDGDLDIISAASVSHDIHWWENTTITEIENQELIQAPHEISLLQNYPNPFNSSTALKYKLASKSNISINIYNSQGALVRTLHHSAQNRGINSIIWDGRNVNGIDVCSGIYFYTLNIDEQQMMQSRKMLLLR